jgi:4-hydroxythreonine-4-phosphate dehydrogenase
MSSSAPARNDARPVIAVTPGEPAGIGPDLAVMLAQRDAGARLVLITDPVVLAARADALGLPLRTVGFAPDQTPPAGAIEVLACHVRTGVRAGRLDTANAPYVLECLDHAARGCLEHTFDAMLTGPVHKGIINDAHIPFTGHTEYLADAAGGGRPVMMLAAGSLRVALVTTHVALRAVPDLITRPALDYTLRTVSEALVSQFGLRAPRIAVCGLNPHAGENGHMGREEIETIEPVLAECRSAGMDVRGPLPADTAFTPDRLREVDAIVAMYHDQGLAALKALGFGQAVNITLGLPFIRTSVDHGTALDLAGTGRANPESLQAALSLAIQLAVNRRGRATLG